MRIAQRVFAVSFRPGRGPEETEEQQMDLLSATVSFLVANGNNTTDEVQLKRAFWARGCRHCSRGSLKACSD